MPEAQLAENDLTALRLERTDSEPYVITVSTPDGGRYVPGIEITAADRMTQAAVDLGYVSVRVASSSTNRSASPNTLQALQIQMGTPPADGVVAISNDGVLWEPIPRIPIQSLTIAQSAGYFIDSNGHVVILTNKPGVVGIRKKRAELNIREWIGQVIPGSAMRLLIDGQAGEDPVRLSIQGSGSACEVSSTQVVRAVESGVCAIGAVQGGGSMYMSSVTKAKVADITLLGEIRSSVIEYRTSLSMLTVAVLLSFFLAWQCLQTIAEIRKALRTDPSAL